MAQQPIPEGSGFAFEMSLRALDEQLRRIEALDSKAGILIAADGILTGLLLSGRGPLLQAPKPVLFAAVAAVISSLSFALLAFISRRYDSAPGPAAVIRLMTASEDWLKWRFLGSLESALELNRRKVRWKVGWLTWGAALLIVGTGVLGGYFLHGILSGSIGVE